MSGFALVFDINNPMSLSDATFTSLTQSVVDYKNLNPVTHTASGKRCVAAKLDTKSTLHRGITVDERSGSWLMAVGTVCDQEHNPTDGNLQFLLSNYLEHGEVAFKGLDGQFALVIYHKSLDKLLVVSDPFGAISVFWARQGSKVYLATSALAIANVIQATPSEYGVYLFLTSGSVFGRYTLWNEVERLSPATILELTTAGPKERHYWLPEIRDFVTELSISDTEDYILDVMSRLFRTYLSREGKTWTDLTGGFDSRFVTLFADFCDLPFKSVCHGPNGSLDVQISSMICKGLGWDYQHFMLPSNWGQKRFNYLGYALGKGDGHAEVFKGARVIYSQELQATQFNTAVWGLGGEIWRGFFWKQEFNKIGKTPNINYDRLVDYRILHPIAENVFDNTNRITWIREELKDLLKSVADRYDDLPNTVKLDCIYAYKNTGHTGTYTSMVMGLRRALSPLFFKEAFTAAFSTNYKWRNHSHLVRRLLEHVNPKLASFETSAGGPALTMHLTNIHKFRQYWKNISLSLARKGLRELLGRDIIPPGGSELGNYPLHRWRRETLECLEKERMLDYTYMHSGRLYNPQSLLDFVQQAKTNDSFSQETFLSRIVTVEMALRAVGASF